jgi:hypothetical protein
MHARVRIESAPAPRRGRGTASHRSCEDRAVQCVQSQLSRSMFSPRTTKHSARSRPHTFPSERLLERFCPPNIGRACPLVESGFDPRGNNISPRFNSCLVCNLPRRRPTQCSLRFPRIVRECCFARGGREQLHADISCSSSSNWPRLRDLSACSCAFTAFLSTFPHGFAFVFFALRRASRA